ncbi:MAG: FtsX-like permease family protein [Gilliamella sp.]|uniref:ABC transporter permease n=1 Tax=Gilliamella TaxID=1193503 RepID=UPI000A157593|nr:MULTISPECIES: FtsX-like permease family protein [Gilliamella]MCO6537587.1 FtsX-like permease family protein [Gilliamella sp.]MCO6539971.1 FtsX-like permease family protein [Gilliamella sp.]MCO6557046.1 FtsX-like permease family protein [Gilliamella sp.]
MINKNRRFIIKTVLSSLIRRRSRIAIALLGVAIGATVLLGMITLCYDIPRQMGQEFRSYGANLLLLPANNQSTVAMTEVNKAVTFLPEDKLLGVTPFRYNSIRSNQQPYTIVGTDFKQVVKTSPYWSIEGSIPQNSHEIMIGTDIANFAKLNIGSTMPISGKSKQDSRFDEELTVTGIVKTGRSEDNFIFVDLHDLEELLEESEQAEVVEVSIAATETELKQYIEKIKKQMTTVEPHLIKWVTKSEASVLGKLSSLLYLVTFVVLVLTMICVATTMMTVVMERRKEIGLKKAIGANNKSIAKEFLAEGLVLGVIGGFIGAICGLIFAQIISTNVFGRSIIIEFYLIPTTIIISVIVTVIACLIPVKRALEVEPALVLRGE